MVRRRRSGGRQGAAAQQIEGGAAEDPALEHLQPDALQEYAAAPERAPLASVSRSITPNPCRRQSDALLLLLRPLVLEGRGGIARAAARDLRLTNERHADLGHQPFRFDVLRQHEADNPPQ